MADGPILVSEDDLANRRLLEDRLTSAGYRVLEAPDGVGLPERARRARPALIVLDIRLPGPDGFTLAEQLKTDPETRGIPVLAVTASVRSEDRLRALWAGTAGYLSKPLDTQELLQNVSRILE